MSEPEGPPEPEPRLYWRAEWTTSYDASREALEEIVSGDELEGAVRRMPVFAIVLAATKAITREGVKARVYDAGGDDDRPVLGFEAEFFADSEELAAARALMLFHDGTSAAGLAPPREEDIRMTPLGPRTSPEDSSN